MPDLHGSKADLTATLRQAALKRLLAVASGAGGGAAALATARVAVRCLAGLLVALPHFNYASDLLQVLLRWALCLVRPTTARFLSCCYALRVQFSAGHYWHLAMGEHRLS